MADRTELNEELRRGQVDAEGARGQLNTWPRLPLPSAEEVRSVVERALEGSEGASVQVEVDDRHVTLTGAVNTDADLRRAMEAACHVIGVTAVTGRVRVAGVLIAYGPDSCMYNSL